MLRTAFSTVACPEWTLDRVADVAARCAFQGVELRSQGYAGGIFASDPALTDGATVRGVLMDRGVALAGVASGATLDRPVRPPVIGHVLGIDNRVVEGAKRFVDIASACGAGYVRLFGCRCAPRERRSIGMRRIVERLRRVCDHADKRGVLVVIENAGDFATSADLVEIIEGVDSALIRAAYDPALAMGAGDDPVDGVRSLARVLEIVRLRDTSGDRPVAPGTGDVPLERIVGALAGGASDAWLVATWDRAWIDALAPAEEILPAVADRLAAWSDVRTGAAA